MSVDSVVSKTISSVVTVCESPPGPVPSLNVIVVFDCPTLVEPAGGDTVAFREIAVTAGGGTGGGAIRVTATDATGQIQVTTDRSAGTTPQQ